MSNNEMLLEGQPSPALSTTTRSKAPKKGSTSILIAALSGLSMALGWENHKEESTIVVDAPDHQDWLNLDVGPLDQLDHTGDV